MKTVFLALIICLLFPAESPAGQLRIVSLVPGATEILFELDLENQLVGATNFCNYPPGARLKAKIGDFSNPNIEKILKLEPDLIIATGLEQASVIRNLKKLNLNVLEVFPSGIDDLFESILKIGKATNREKESIELVAKLNKKLSKIKEKIDKIPQTKREKVYIEIWNDPLTTASSGSFENDLIKAAGGKNIAAGFVNGYGRISAEIIIKQDPDCIILGYMQNAQERLHIAKREGWKDISAVKNNKIYDDIDPDILFRPGPRFAEAVQQIYERLYER